VRAIAECYHAVSHSREIRLLSFKTAKKRLCVVGDIALSIGGCANQESAATLKDASIEAVHHPNRSLMACRLQCLLYLLRHHLSRPGHGSDQDRDAQPHPFLLAPPTNYNASIPVKMCARLSGVALRRLRTSCQP